MPWEFFLIPLIALGVLILSTVLRGPPDPKTRPRRLADQPPRRRQLPQPSTQPAGPQFEMPVPLIPSPVGPAGLVPLAKPPPETIVVSHRPEKCPPPSPRAATGPFKQSLRALLENPRNAALGVVLREILDRPVSMRKR